jgi:DNA-binding NarL/FixJ family response regulator
MPDVSVRVLIVEDHEPYRKFLSSLIQKRPGFRIVSQVADGAEAVRMAEKLRPDLILLDIGLPGLNGIEAARRILRVCPETSILFESQESSEEVVFEALGVGLAVGYLLKVDAASELMAGIDNVLLGKKFRSRSIVQREQTPSCAPEHT